MVENKLSVREIQPSDIESLLQYWYGSDDSFLMGMGVDVSKMPARDQFKEFVLSQIGKACQEKGAYVIIWEADGKPVGHSNTNPTEFGKEAFMHLHLWNGNLRKKGAGTEFVKMTLPYFFENLALEKLYCQPYSLNEAPNRALQKVGFDFVREYVTIPGFISFEQPVKLWEMTREKFEKLFQQTDQKV